MAVAVVGNEIAGLLSPIASRMRTRLWCHEAEGDNIEMHINTVCSDVRAAFAH